MNYITSLMETAKKFEEGEESKNEIHLEIEELSSAIEQFSLEKFSNKISLTLAQFTDIKLRGIYKFAAEVLSAFDNTDGYKKQYLTFSSTESKHLLPLCEISISTNTGYPVMLKIDNKQLVLKDKTELKNGLYQLVNDTNFIRKMSEFSKIVNTGKQHTIESGSNDNGMSM